MTRRLLGLIGLALVLNGCSLAPKYTRPPSPVPDAWPADAPGTASGAGTPAADLPWRAYFADARLQSVVELALANNRDLRIAALNIERAQALYRIQRSELAPTVDAAAEANVSDALTLRTRLAEQRAAETSLVTALDQTQRLSDARYEAGMDSYLQVLVADRALFAGQQSLVDVRLAEQVNLVTLYKVLGGGV